MVATGVDFERLFRTEYPRLVALGVAMTGSTEVYCISPQGCGVSLTAKPIAQIELLGGIGVNF